MPMKFLKNGIKNTDGKKYKIILSPIFIDEVEDIYFYISKKLKEENTAKKFINSIKSKIKLVKSYPYIYAKLDDKHKLDVIHRKIITGSYVMIYMVNEDNLQVRISHIYYQGEDYLKKI